MTKGDWYRLAVSSDQNEQWIHKSAVASERPTKKERQTKKDHPTKRDYSYTIIDVDVVPGIKRSLSVRLSKKISTTDLHDLALELKALDAGQYDRTFITYYLPGMTVGSGAWATTHFNPTLKVEILGLSANEERALLSPPQSSTRNIIGQWILDGIGGRTIVLYRENDRIFRERAFKDGSKSTDELVSTPSSLGQRFEEKGGNSFGEYYLIDESGNLQLWDQEGLIDTARKVSR